ncbi:ArsR family transcriptional regulator [Streptomyces sp. NTH33]|uniref:ArsR family transcriptional regulator n=1 Tax=Streptomyces sp. NTH33 TaxID=1735453 RepID=UPI000DAA29BA|nr:ArsR family transcriptional regulator [Streptomyces sp. NTH33]PZH19767.1 ArsR family transcriptional regulator [Streptomyces sp. NTH33]
MLRTSAGRTRLLILEWLRDPAAHAPRRRRDPLTHGATAKAVAAGLGIPRRTAGTHLALLTDLGLLRARRIRCRTYYSRDEVRIAEVARMFEKGW